MSIQQGNNGTPAGQTAMSEAFTRAGAAPQQQSQQQSQSAGQGQPRATRGGNAVLELNNTRLRRPMSRNQTGELTAALVRELEGHMQDAMGPNFRDSYSIHVLDNSSNLIALSTILVCFTVTHDGVNHCSVFQLVVEGSGARLSNRFVNIGGQNVEIDVVPGDVVDRAQWERITGFLSDVFGQKLEFHNAGAAVIPTELSVEDKTHLHRVLYSATQALYTVTDNDVIGFEAPLTIKDIDANTNLSATLDYNPPALDNDVGLPVRSDISVILRATLANSGGALQHEQVREITRVDGYIDLVYSEPAPQAWNAPPVTQRYYPRFVITGLDSQIDAITPELQLLALSTAGLLSKNMAWGGVYRPRYSKSGQYDLRDIGAIGYEVNLTGDPNARPERVDTKADSFSTTSLYALLQQTVHDSLLYSMDIEEVGTLAWLHQVFIAAANNEPGAYRSIVDAATRLTDGHFSQYWQGGPICVDDNNRVHLGYYIDQDGSRRDIRDIDYLALLNLIGEKDMATVVNWSKSFDDVNVPAEIRLEQRAKLLKALLPGVQLKGYARRVTFYPEFLTALTLAASAAGLTIRPSNLINDFTGTGTRPTYQAAQFAVNSQMGQGLFNWSAPNAYGGRGMGGPFFGRYG